VLSELTIFSPLVPFVLFLAWGIWKQRRNPRLPVALAAGFLFAIAGIALGAAGVVIGAGVAFGACVICGLVSLALR